jgi:hypothetical protein
MVIPEGTTSSGTRIPQEELDSTGNYSTSLKTRNLTEEWDLARNNQLMEADPQGKS